MKVLDVPQLVHHGQAAIPIHAFSVSNPHLNPCENSHKSPMQVPPKKTEEKLKLFTHHQSQHHQSHHQENTLKEITRLSKNEVFSPPTPTKRGVQLALQRAFQNLIFYI
jgi:hypothetical protein